MATEKNPTSDRRWLRASEAAKRLQISFQTFWRWRRAGIAPAPEGKDPFGHDLWTEQTIENFYADRSNGSAA